MSGHLLMLSIAQQRNETELRRKPEQDLQTVRDSCRTPTQGAGWVLVMKLFASHWSSARCLVAEGVGGLR